MIAGIVICFIQILTFIFALFTVNSIPCDITQKECYAYGDMDKDGNEIKWPEGRHHGSFLMSDATYNQYWSTPDQKIFKLSHYLAGASIALQALFTAYK